MQKQQATRPAWIILCYVAMMSIGFLGELRGLPWYTKQVMMMGCTGLAFVDFLLYGRTEHVKIIVEYFWIQVIPFVGMIAISMFFWGVDLQALNYISRGCSTVLYLIIVLCMVSAAVYMFGERAAEYTLYSMTIANIIIVLSAIETYGIGAFSAAFAVFVRTFGVITDPPMKALEVHDLTFAFTLYFIYYIIAGRGERHRVRNFIIVCIFTYLGLKRIALIGDVAVLMLFLVFQKRRESTQRMWLMIMGWMGIAICVGYVYMIRSEWFNMIVDYFQIDTMGRQRVYQEFKQYYTFDPLYRGTGIGHVTRLISILTENKVGVFGTHGFGGLHNDIATLYIELGFWGFIIWLFYQFQFRVQWVITSFGPRCACFFFYCMVYAFVTYATDNTAFYCFMNMAYMMLPLVFAVREYDHPDIYKEKV